uniref:Uncharacterized protein n=1 Tax=Periophthalmus magnuspinnatus TaxID=409849 RepID=A0A3B4B2H6_9GOBI
MKGRVIYRRALNIIYVIPQLSNTSVCMKDPQRVRDILESMQKAGSNTLQVISDFDMTLTRFAFNGKRCPTYILDNSRLINDECKLKLKELLNTYYPIEIDSTRSVEEKLPLMVEWWTKAHELLIEQKIKKDALALAVRESEAMLRDGYEFFFNHLHEHSIPLLIFSAGIGDILEEVIRQAGVFHSNVNVFSNYMDFDELDMENILKIGFLNDKVEDRRQSYLDSYDIVLIKDETLEVPNAIVRFLTGNE